MNLVVGIIIAAVVGVVWFVNHNMEESYKKPWWTGTKEVRLCVVPYYDNSACHYASASSDGDNVTSVTTNGQTFNIFDSECFKASSGEAADRFCRISESGKRYDILPG